MTILQVLLVFMIIAALIAVEAKELLSAVIALGTLGFAMALCFLLLQAPDLAVILLVVEMVVLTTVMTYTRKLSAPIERRDWLLRLGAAAVVLSFMAICGLALKELPRFGHAYGGFGRLYSTLALQQTGAANTVAAVALDFRSYDTLAAAALLFLVALGVSSLIGKAERKIK